MSGRDRLTPGQLLAETAGPSPIDPELPPPPDMPIGWLDERVQDWIRACSAATGAPITMPAIAAICVGMAALNGRLDVKIREGWVEPVNLYAIVTAPSGGRKSTVLTPAQRRLRAIQAQIEAEVKPRARGKDLEKRALEQRLRRQASAERHDKAAENDIIEQLVGLEIPHAPRLIVEDINPSMLCKTLAANLRSTTGRASTAIIGAEDTFLQNMRGKWSKELDLTPVLQGFSGEAISVDRASKDSDGIVTSRIERPVLTILQMIQPVALEELDARCPQLAQRGFWSRFLVLHMPTVPLPEWEVATIPDDVQERYDQWIDELWAIEPGTVVDLSGEEVSRDTYELSRKLASERQGAEAWLSRAVSRLCKLLALARVTSCHVSHQSPLHPRLHTLKGSDIQSLSYYILSSLLPHAAMLEPECGVPLPNLTAVTLRHLRHKYPVGSLVTSRMLQRDLHRRKSAIDPVIDLMCDTGYLELATPASLKSGAIYRVLAHDVRADPAVDLERAYRASHPPQLSASGAELQDVGYGPAEASKRQALLEELAEERRMMQAPERLGDAIRAAEEPDPEDDGR